MGIHNRAVLRDSINSDIISSEKVDPKESLKSLTLEITQRIFENAAGFHSSCSRHHHPSRGFQDAAQSVVLDVLCPTQTGKTSMQVHPSLKSSAGPGRAPHQKSPGGISSIGSRNPALRIAQNLHSHLGLLVLIVALFTGVIGAKAIEVNLPPVANAGVDQSVYNLDPVQGTPTVVTLNGTQSYDPEGKAITYSWAQTGGPAVTLIGATTATPTFTAPNLGNATLTFTLTVRDNGRVSGKDEVLIHILQTPLAKIGDFVWKDLNQNGLQEAGEPGIDGVTVTLKDSSGNLVATTVTAANGFYQFTRLAAGTYTVGVDRSASPALEGLLASPANVAGSTAEGDSNLNPATVTLASATASDQSVDFGFYVYVAPTGTIGNLLWKDINQNGVQDSQESGIEGVKLTLKDGSNNILATTTTTANGAYLFTGLAAGTYSVEADTSSPALAGFIPTFTNAPGISTESDSNENPFVTTLASDNSSDLSVDFGYIPAPAGSIGDYIWKDLNGDGIQGAPAEEGGIAGVTVELFSANNTLLATQTTDGDGYYLFSGLSAGTYVVKVAASQLIGGYVYAATTVNAPGSSTANDSSGTAATVVLPLNTDSDTGADFGYTPVPAARIGNLVWNDLNDNGIQDSGENGIPGVTIKLLNQSGEELASTVTAIDGSYAFTQLAAGTYTVAVDNASAALTGFIPTATSADGSTTENDSNPNLAVVTLLSNTATDESVDFGYVLPTGAIGNFVWNDLNQNGIQDSGEPGIGGVTVTLSGLGNALLATQVTSANGGYAFTGLRAGTYSVALDTASPALASYIATTSLADGSHSASDSNILPAVVTLSTNISTDDTVDFGYLKPSASIGNLVWKDLNQDGIQQSDEPGINGVTVTLFDAGNSPVATAVTAGNGNYLFSGLQAGNYTVTIQNNSASLAGLLPTDSNVFGSTIENDSNATPVAILLAANNSQDLSVDFGYVPTPAGSIGDSVWEDVDGNGIRDPLEAGIAGVTVKLLAPGNLLVATTITDIDGLYLFSGLKSGSYTVLVDNSSPALAGFAPTTPNAAGSSSATDSNVNPSTVTLPLNTSSDLTVDFGYTLIPAASIGNLVWKDSNQDGIQQTNEPGINGVTIRLYNAANALIATTTTAGNGAYLFTGLGAGSYSVSVESASSSLAGLIPTSANVEGSTPANDSNPLPVTVVLAKSNTADLSVDFGYVAAPSGSIGDRVWNDADGNGIQGALEAGIAGVTVKLFDEANVLLGTTTTNASGLYLFSDLKAGTYVVAVDNSSGALAGFAPTTTNATGATAATDSNINPATVVLPLNTSSDTTIDFGYSPVRNGRIGDFVWKDLNGNGIQETGEPGINGVTIKLYGTDNVLVSKVVTSGNGGYLFTGLVAGTYTVSVDTTSASLSGLLPTATGALGSTIGNDSNAANSIVTLTTANYTDLSIDFGYKNPPAYGPLTTYTIGGWGTSPSGSNPGAFLAKNFATVYPNGLTLGGGFTMKFTSAKGIENFLPSGGTARALTQSYINPTTTLGVLSSQILAVRLAVDFSKAGVTAGNLANAKFKTGKFAGKTIGQVLATAEAVLGGASLPAGISYSDLNTACALVNENYDEGADGGKFINP